MPSDSSITWLDSTVPSGRCRRLTAMRRFFMDDEWRGEELPEMWAALVLLLEEAVADALLGGALDNFIGEAVACGCGGGGCGVGRCGIGG